MKKITAQQIIDNINARNSLLAKQGFDQNHPVRCQLQDLLDDICRHNMAIENIDDSTRNRKMTFVKQIRRLWKLARKNKAFLLDKNML